MTLDLSASAIAITAIIISMVTVGAYFVFAAVLGSHLREIASDNLKQQGKLKRRIEALERQLRLRYVDGEWQQTYRDDHYESY